eukprot:CAMPEP_0116844558 /NCGR_PEP_ID=MMETSP0418-20121206/12763_1 /TAXON_ID=1158023 /ORGANISM="Astrosyne radiata, Strain 13vi08-1A" /LENGTH=220 /DNA_ID=CAMNT_0004475541 /DNA_START=73 /DNA_END=735 /DNA_ORIENTATION=+
MSQRLLLDRIGGATALELAVEKCYARLIADKRLKDFFVGVNIEALMTHQVRFMLMAFTHIPKSVDVHTLIVTKHSRLFDMGLSEVHFDIFAEHFTATLQELNIDEALIDEALVTVVPLRPCFEEGAKIAREKKAKGDREADGHRQEGCPVGQQCDAPVKKNFRKSRSMRIMRNKDERKKNRSQTDEDKNIGRRKRKSLIPRVFGRAKNVPVDSSNEGLAR